MKPEDFVIFWLHFSIGCPSSTSGSKTLGESPSHKKVPRYLGTFALQDGLEICL